MKFYSVTRQMYDTDLYNPMGVFSMLYKLALTFDSVNKIPSGTTWDNSNKSCHAVLYFSVMVFSLLLKFCIFSSKKVKMIKY